MRLSTLISLFIVATIAGQAHARAWRVSSSGSGNLPTIQGAIDSAAAGDTIVVAAGTYVENLDMIGKRLILQGESGATATVVDGNRLASVLLMSAGEVVGLTLRNGLTVGGGGGIGVVGPGPTTIRQCIIEDNIAGVTFDQGGGGGIYLSISTQNVTVADNVIRRNFSTGPGGGIEDSGLFNIFTGNIIDSNLASLSGGGIYTQGSIVSGNIIIGNTANIGGGGIGIGSGGSVIRSNTIVGNHCILGSGAGIFGGSSIIDRNIVAHNGPGGGVVAPGATATTCNDLWLNDFDTIGSGNGNFHADPLFCDRDRGIYSLSANSPCAASNNPVCGLIGALGVGCGTTAVESATWSHLKTLYRAPK